MARLRLVDSSAPGLVDAEDELYAAGPEEFIGRRKELVAAARADKNRELATAIGQLRRPTRSAWLLNLLVRAEPDQVSALLDIGEALAQAQRRRSGDDLRRLSKDRRVAVDAATKRAVAIGVEHGHTAADSTVTEVTQTLTAALADAAVAEDLRRGRLATAVSYGGFGPDALGDALAAMSGSSGAAPAPEAEATEDAEPEVDPEVAERAAALAAAQEAAETARAAADDAEAAAETATVEADELADRVEQLKTELAETAEAAEKAQRAARDGRRRAQELRKAAEDAEKALVEMASP